MAMRFTLPSTDSPKLYIVEVIGGDGVVHHLGPFKDHDAAEAWIAQNASPQCCGDLGHTLANDAGAREQKSGLSAV
jgi:hypothetical protein